MTRLARGQGGFTLVELVVGVAILGLISSVIVSSLFHVWASKRYVVDDGLAVWELRQVSSWLARDVRSASSTDLIDGAAPASSVTLTWTDEYGGSGTSHAVSYSLAGQNLIRTYDGTSLTLARRVASLGVSLSGNKVTADLEVEAEPGATRSLTLSTLMKPGTP